MRFEEGENLGALLERRGTLPEKDLLRILLPILDGLELVHNAGFIHRDIKPDNIHIRVDGSPVLLDFGSARHALGKSRTLTILVAPGYAPFEQYHANSENQGPWTDIYGLAATCYRAIAGTQPLDAITRSKGILGSTREVLVPARNIGSGRYSSQLLAAIDHALEFNEKDRPQTVSEWRREILGEVSVAPAVPKAVASVPPQRAELPAAPPLPPSNSGPTGPIGVALPKDAVVSKGLSVRWSVVWIAGGTLGAIAGAIAIAVFLWPSPPDPNMQIAQIQQELDRTRALLDKDRAMDAKTREKLLALLEQQEEAKRRQEEQARLAEQKKLDEERRRVEEEKRKLAARPKPPAIPATKPLPPSEITARPPPPVIPVEPELSETPPVVALVKPKPDPLAEQLARGEGALARGEYEKAHEILTPLAKEGNARAQVRLAEMYAFGQGVKQNTIQSYIWYSLAAQGGNTSAVAGRDRMAARLQPVEVKQADKVVESMRTR
jgi:hypothetical protein